MGVRTICYCGNLLVNVYVAESNSNKKTIGKICIHCDVIREHTEFFQKLKETKIKQTKEKNKYKVLDNKKEHCPYCKGTKFESKKIPSKIIKGQKNNPYVKYKCKNNKCKSKEHEGIWTVSLPMNTTLI